MTARVPKTLALVEEPEQIVGLPEPRVTGECIAQKLLRLRLSGEVRRLSKPEQREGRVGLHLENSAKFLFRLVQKASPQQEPAGLVADGDATRLKAQGLPVLEVGPLEIPLADVRIAEALVAAGVHL